jgi:Mg2+/citrate symporter
MRVCGTSEDSMVVLALLLIVIAAVVTVGVLVAGPTSTTFEVFNQSYDTNTVVIFLAGVVTGAVFLLALALVAAGMRRSRQRRLEMRALRERHTDSVRELEQEKERLAREKRELAERLERERDEAPPPGPRASPTPQA